MYVTKYYVGYRTGKRRLRLALMSRIGGNGRITICLSKSVDDIIDAKGLCTDKRPTCGVGPGCPTAVNYDSNSDLESIMELINQC